MRPLVALLPFVTACYFHVPPPLPGGAPLETGQAPPPGGAEMQLEAQGAVWLGAAPVTLDGALRAGVGVTPNLALSAEGGLMRIHGVTEGTTVDGRARLGRLGALVHRAEPWIRNPGLKDHEGILVGVGGGDSAVFGRWLTIDVGAVFALETRYASFFVNLSLFASPVLESRAYAPPPAEDPEDPLGPPPDWDNRLQDSYGFHNGWGVELRPERDSPVSLLLGYSWGWTEDKDVAQVAAGVGAALRLKTF